jgi:hypothetical protein
LCCPFGQPRHAGLRNPVREDAGHGGGSAGDVQPGVDGFQVCAHSSLGYAQAAGDLGVGVPGGEQAQQFPVPTGELRDRAAAFGVEIGLVQMRAQQYQQRPVMLGNSPFRSWPSPPPVSGNASADTLGHNR